MDAYNTYRALMQMTHFRNFLQRKIKIILFQPSRGYELPKTEKKQRTKKFCLVEKHFLV